MRITVITWLTTALLLTKTNGGERSSKQLFYTTYLYPSSSSSSSLRSNSNNAASGSRVISSTNTNAFLTPQISLSPLDSFWSSFGDHKGRQAATLIPVNNANQAYQQQLRQQQVLWSPSLPLGTSSFISSPVHQQLLQQHHHPHSGLTTAGGGGSTANNNIVVGSTNNAASKNVKHASASPPSNAQFILQSHQQIGPEYQIHPESSLDTNTNSLNGLPILGYFNVPLNPTYSTWNPYSSVPGSPQSTVHSYLQNGLLSSSPTAGGQNQWNLPLKSYEQIHNELFSNSIVPTSLVQQQHQQPKPVNPLKGFQRGHIEASQGVTTISPPILKAAVAGNNVDAGGFIRGHIESKPSLVTYEQVVAGIRNAGQHSILQQQQQHLQHHFSLSSSSGFNRGAVEHRFPETSAAVPLLKATTYDTPTKNVVCYFASWAADRKREGMFLPEHADPTLCTHIIYAFAVLDKSKFAIKESDPTTDNRKCKEKQRDDAQNNITEMHTIRYNIQNQENDWFCFKKQIEWD